MVSGVFSVYAFVVFLALMFLLFPMVLLASLAGKIKGGNIIYSICRFWTDSALFMWGIHHKNHFEAPKSTDHAIIFVFNHISYMDIPILLKVFRRYPIRILGKAEMSKIPIFGYIYSKAVIMVDRRSAHARSKSVKEMKEMLGQKISIVIAPEGTFNMTSNPLKEFYDGAFKIAIETKTSIQPVIFLDAFDRLSYKSIFSLTPGRSRAIFLNEIKVEQYNNEEVNLLKQEVYTTMEKALIQNKASWIKVSNDVRK